jgi:hypothetical protein
VKSKTLFVYLSIVAFLQVTMLGFGSHFFGDVVERISRDISATASAVVCTVLLVVCVSVYQFLFYKTKKSRKYDK